MYAVGLIWTKVSTAKKASNKCHTRSPKMDGIPKTSKAAVLEEYNKPLQIQEIPIPKSSPRGILVKVEMAGICGTDVHQRGER